MSCCRWIALALVVCSGLARESRAQSCDLVAAALRSVDADSANAVLVDHTVMGVPVFAFNAYTGVQRGDTALARTAEPALRTLNRTRLPIPACMSDERGWTTVPDTALFALFRAADGWAAFRERFPKFRQFVLVSQPIISGDTATFYMAVASGKLSGRGMIVRLVRDAAGNWAKHSEVQLWIS